MLAANGCVRAVLYEHPGQLNETSPDSKMKRRFLLAVGCPETCAFLNEHLRKLDVSPLDCKV